MKFERQIKEELDVNLTPLIDVVFLLLIFFMVTTTFSRDASLVINLPEASGEELEVVAQQIDIVVAKNGSYSVNGDNLINSQLDTLMRAITIKANGDTAIPLVITADAETSHQSVVTVMDAVAQLGFTRLNIATQQTSEEP